MALGGGPRSGVAVAEEAERRRRFWAHSDRLDACPPHGSWRHWSYQWPSESDAVYAERTRAFREYGECESHRHAMTPDNLDVDQNGGERSCRACRDERQARRRAAGAG